MVKGVEDLRTPLQTILDLECQLRGSIAGFLMPQFVVDLPGGGGKRLFSTADICPVTTADVSISIIIHRIVSPYFHIGLGLGKSNLVGVDLPCHARARSCTSLVPV